MVFPRMCTLISLAVVCPGDGEQLVLGLWAFRFLCYEYHLNLIPSALPAATAEDLRREMMFTYPTLNSFFWSLQVTGVILQLDHNRRSGTFAGQYALTAYLEAGISFLRLVYHIPGVVGRTDAAEGIGLQAVVSLGAEGLAVWQAIGLPKMVQAVVDEDED